MMKKVPEIFITYTNKIKRSYQSIYYSRLYNWKKQLSQIKNLPSNNINTLKKIFACTLLITIMSTLSACSSIFNTNNTQEIVQSKNDQNNYSSTQLIESNNSKHYDDPLEKIDP
jgi:hypothetical protein